MGCDFARGGEDEVEDAVAGDLVDGVETTGADVLAEL